MNSIAYRHLFSMRIIMVILCGAFSVPGHAADPAYAEGTQAGDWSTDVIGVNELQLSADYWLEKMQDAGQVLKDQSGITDFNKALFASDPNMVDLALFPEQLAGTDVRNRILAISKPNNSGLYSPSGEALGEDGYRKYMDKLGLEKIPPTVAVQYALVVSRADMRTYPTGDRYYKTVEDQNLDRFQENGLFPGDAVAVLHSSADGEWVFVQSYNYAAWVPSSQIAIGERKAIEQFKKAEPFLVITGDKVLTSFNPQYPALSELQLDMGIRVPLAGHDSTGNNLYGQNPYASHAVLLPMRNHEGRLEIRPALIARSKDVSRGYIAFTRENIIRQAFKFLGERYGWGHSYNARDCTGFIMEIYKTFGFMMPRNTGQQGEASYGQNTRFTSQSNREEKLQALKQLDIGDLIYVPGHVLMFIGDVNGEPYVIHDVSVFRYIDDNGEYYEGTLNGVSVTPLIPLYGSRQSPYVDLIYNIKHIR